MANYVTIIGRSEEIDIIDSAMHIPAKIDTGAHRSSIHATDIKLVKEDDGTQVLYFNILGHPCSPIKRTMRSTHFDKIKVRSSTGHEEERYEVKLKIKLGKKVFVTSFSLSNRSKNVYPVLIGRKALKNRFVVDISKSSVKKSQLLKSLGVTRPRDEEDLED